MSEGSKAERFLRHLRILRETRAVSAPAVRVGEEIPDSTPRKPPAVRRRKKADDAAQIQRQISRASETDAEQVVPDKPVGAPRAREASPHFHPRRPAVCTLALAKKDVAHSIQEFRGRSEVINDLDLMVLFMFLPAVGNPKRPFFAWEHTLRHYGPGLIDLALDSLTESEAREFATALHGIRDQLSSFGAHIPRSWLHERKITPGIVFADFPVRSVIEASARLENLVSAEVAHEKKG